MGIAKIKPTSSRLGLNNTNKSDALYLRKEPFIQQPSLLDKPRRGVFTHREFSDFLILLFFAEIQAGQISKVYEQFYKRI